jgi:protein-disulfide isomerase
MTKEAKILIGIAVLVVIGGVLLAIYANPQKEAPGASVDKDSLVRETSHMTGKKDAKVTIVEFGDFQCPACAAAHPEVKAALENFKDNPNVNFVFRNFPLETIHPNARISSEAAEAAGVQGKYWEMHDKLYTNQKEWSTSQTPLDIFVKYATEISLNVNDFKVSVEQRLHADVIDADLKDGQSAGVNSTPTFFINGSKQNKVLTKDELKTLIDAELAK